MKKNIYLLIVITVLLLTGCKKQSQMVDFIPTPVPTEEDSNEVSDEATGEEDSSEEANNEETTEEAQTPAPTPKTLHVGETTTMYVKMDEYGAVLNVRETPSKDGKVVGSLVHTEKVEVIEIVDGWASFAVDNEIRYISADFLVEVRPDYLAPPSPTPTPVVAAPTTKATPTPTPKAASEEAPPEI